MPSSDPKADVDTSCITSISSTNQLRTFRVGSSVEPTLRLMKARVEFSWGRELTL